MKPSHKAVLGSLVVAIVAVAAGAWARSPSGDPGSSNARMATVSPNAARSPGFLISPAPPAPAEDLPPPPQHDPDMIDWGNPYDVMLHGIRPGRTRDMR
jgi:hypothetical protein